MLSPRYDIHPRSIASRPSPLQKFMLQRSCNSGYQSWPDLFGSIGQSGHNNSLARKSKTLAYRSKFTSPIPLTSDRPAKRVGNSPDVYCTTCRATRRSNERGSATLSRCSGCGGSVISPLAARCRRLLASNPPSAACATIGSSWIVGPEQNITNQKKGCERDPFFYSWRPLANKWLEKAIQAQLFLLFSR